MDSQHIQEKCSHAFETIEPPLSGLLGWVLATTEHRISFLLRSIPSSVYWSQMEFYHLSSTFTQEMASSGQQEMPVGEKMGLEEYQHKWDSMLEMEFASLPSTAPEHLMWQMWMRKAM